MDSQRHQAIESEYMKLQEIVERFDDRALTIKAWSVTLCTVASAPRTCNNRLRCCWSVQPRRFCSG